MKQIFMILCSLLLVISFTACSLDYTQSSTTTPSIVLDAEVESKAPIAELQLQHTTEQEETKSTPTLPENAPETELPKSDTIRSMKITVGNTSFSATLAENAAVDAFIKLMQNAPVVINMSDYLGFEKVGSLGTSLPTNNSNVTASEGDIVLYNGNQIVVFYGSNSWSYTRLGKIDDLTEWEEALGDGDVTMTFSIKS